MIYHHLLLTVVHVGDSAIRAAAMAYVAAAVAESAAVIN